MNEEILRKVVREEVQQEVQPVAEKVDRIEERLFIGSPERASMQEELAEARAEIRGLHRERKASRGNGEIWKSLTAIVVAVATAAGAVWGVAASKDQRSDQPTGSSSGQERGNVE